MSWRNRYRPASFRGAAFLVESDDKEGGQNFAAHDYPQRDTDWHEPMGRKTPQFTVEAYIIGPDYMAGRDALERACEAPEAGTLMHPWYGEIRAKCTGYRVRQSDREGGMARFSLTFTEATDNAFPLAVLHTPSAVLSAAGAALEAVEAGFAGVFTIANLPGRLATAATGLVGEAARAIDGAARDLIPGALGAGLGSALTAAADFNHAVAALRADASALIATPWTLAARITGLVSGAAGLGATPRAATAALSALGDFRSTGSLPEPSVASDFAESRNRAAIETLVRRTAVTKAASVSAAAAFESVEDAVTVRDALASRLEAEMAVAGDPASAAASPDAYRALAELRVAVIRDITARAADLSRRVTYIPPATAPAVLVAHRLYGDATRGGEIATRNRLRHPGFATGGDGLEVLNA